MENDQAVPPVFCAGASELNNDSNIASSSGSGEAAGDPLLGLRRSTALTFGVFFCFVAVACIAIGLALSAPVVPIIISAITLVALSALCMYQYFRLGSHRSSELQHQAPPLPSMEERSPNWREEERQNRKENKKLSKEDRETLQDEMTVFLQPCWFEIRELNNRMGALQKTPQVHERPDCVELQEELDRLGVTYEDINQDIQQVKYKKDEPNICLRIVRLSDAVGSIRRRVDVMVRSMC